LVLAHRCPICSHEPSYCPCIANARAARAGMVLLSSPSSSYVARGRERRFRHLLVPAALAILAVTVVIVRTTARAPARALRAKVRVAQRDAGSGAGRWAGRAGRLAIAS